MSPSGHQRKQRSRCSSFTLTWWNIPSMSQIKAMNSCRNLISTPVRLLVRSGP